MRVPSLRSVYYIVLAYCTQHRRGRSRIVAVDIGYFLCFLRPEYPCRSRGSLFFLLVMCSAVAPNQAHKSSSLREDATTGRKGRRRSTVFSNYVEQLLRQELPSCMSPIPSLLYSTVFFLLITVVTIPFGAAMFWQTRENTEVILRYDNFAVGNQPSDREAQIERRNIVINPEDNFTTEFSIPVPETLDSPVNTAAVA